MGQESVRVCLFPYWQPGTGGAPRFHDLAHTTLVLDQSIPTNRAPAMQLDQAWISFIERWPGGLGDATPLSSEGQATR